MSVIQAQRPDGLWMNVANVEDDQTVISNRLNTESTKRRVRVRAVTDRGAVIDIR